MIYKKRHKKFWRTGKNWRGSKSFWSPENFCPRAVRKIAKQFCIIQCLDFAQNGFGFRPANTTKVYLRQILPRSGLRPSLRRLIQSGGWYRTWTCDLFRVEEALYHWANHPSKIILIFFLNSLSQTNFKLSFTIFCIFFRKIIFIINQLKSFNLLPRRLSENPM